MAPFNYVRAASLLEALDLLSEPGVAARPLAGGTDLLVQLKKGLRSLDRVVDIKGVAETRGIVWSPSDGLTLGAAVTCTEIQESKTIRAHYPALTEAGGLVGGVAIQNRATVGGNLCNAAPSADTVPVLIAYDARVRIRSQTESRLLPVRDFCTGPGHTSLQDGEMVVDIQLPPPAPSSGAAYLRSTPRHEMDIAVAGVGCWVLMEGDLIAETRIALSAVAPVPLVADRAERSLVGRPPSDQTLRNAADLAAEEASPISDVRGSAELRRTLVAALTRRALATAIDRAQR